MVQNALARTFLQGVGQHVAGRNGVPRYVGPRTVQHEALGDAPQRFLRRDVAQPGWHGKKGSRRRHVHDPAEHSGNGVADAWGGTGDYGRGKAGLFNH